MLRYKTTILFHFSEMTTNEKQLQLVVVDDKKALKKSEIVDFPVVLKRGVQGRVKWYSPEDAYGFIHRYDVDEDIFVHGSSIIRFNIRNKNQHPVLGIQQEVEFDVIKVRKGLEARCVSGPGGRLVGRFFNGPRRSVSGVKSQKPAIGGSGVRPIRQRSEDDSSEKEKSRVDSNKIAAVEKSTDDTTKALETLSVREDKKDDDDDDDEEDTPADTEEAKAE